MLTNKAIADYQKIYQEEFGLEISPKDALDQGEKLLRLMDLLLRPITTVSGTKSYLLTTK